MIKLPIVAAFLCGPCAEHIIAEGKEFTKYPQSDREKRMHIKRFTVVSICEECAKGIAGMADLTHPRLMKVLKHLRPVKKTKKV